MEILIQIMNMLTTKINNKKKAKLKLIIQKLSGTFKSKNGEKVEGTAKIENGKLMLKDYKSSKGPDLYVYLTKDGNIKSGKKISTVDYNKSQQTFDLKNIDLNKYNEVTIYCEKAHVIFGGAKLK